MTSDSRPWHRRTYRWGQTNLTEVDPSRYDAAFWREHWRRTRVQGIIVNAGGIVAYYPSSLPQHRAEFLGERDLYGEISRQAREDGLVVLARMDCNRVHDSFVALHPEWIARDSNGQPYRDQDLFVTCVFSDYYEKFVPDVLREIAERYRPDGFTDNSWSGLDRSRICYCDNCRTGFRAASGLELPMAKNWDEPAYRRWIPWNYARRTAIWDLFNATTREAGGETCVYAGMLGGDFVAAGSSFRDLKAICERSEIVMLDSQWRANARGFGANAESGKLLHEILGWSKLIPESTALYGAGQPTFRVTSKPPAEAAMWAIAGFAGGIQPWWHHIGAYHEDRRQYKTAEPIFRWHEENERYLVDRDPVATVGVVWSQRSADFFGRDNAAERISLPWQGVTQALVRARIPYLPVHISDVDRARAKGIRLLILPNVGALSDDEVACLWRFVASGGSLVATGETALCDEWGDRRPDFALADLFGASSAGDHRGASIPTESSWESWSRHSYLRLNPSTDSDVYGPRLAGEPAQVGERHAVLAGFEETNLLGFAGRLEVVRAKESAKVAATFVPPFPIYPPETSWMRESDSGLPALILNEVGASRIAYLPADVDRCYGRDNHPDHARLLANIFEWALRGDVPLRVSGAGLVDCELYRQGDRLILHLVNLTNDATWRAPIHELIPVGPFDVSVRVPSGSSPKSGRLLVAGRAVSVDLVDGWVGFDIPSITDHEVVVIE